MKLADVTAAEETPLGMRRRILEQDFVPYVRGVLANDPKLMSAMLTVAQYWADEADDAVHATVVFSQRKTPIWPHPCRWERDENGVAAFDPTGACSSCGGNLGWMPFDDNGSAIPAFQSCCREDASQESSTAEAYLPYAIARRTASGGIDLEVVGGPVRAWLDQEEGATKASARSSPIADDAATNGLLDLALASPDDDDGPHQVLADHLQQHGDARGELIALSIALRGAEGKRKEEIGARAREVLARHGRAWLGPIADVAPPERVVFDRGLLRAVAVHFADDDVAARIVDAPEWRTVQELRFLPQSRQRLSPSMRALRDVGPLDAIGLAELARIAPELPVERLHVVLAHEHMMRELAKLDLPRLRCLVVGSTLTGPGTVMRRMRNPFTGQEQEFPMESASAAELTPKLLAPIAASRMFGRLEELVLASVAPGTISAWLAVPKDSRPRTIAFTGSSPSFEPGGFRVRVTDDVATVDMPSLGEVAIDVLVQMVRALPPSMRVVMKASRWFEPTEADVRFVAEGAARDVRLG